MGRRLGRHSSLSNGAAAAAAEGESASNVLPSSDASDSVNSLASVSDDEGDKAEEEDEEDEEGEWTAAATAGLDRLLPPAVAATAAARLELADMVASCRRVCVCGVEWSGVVE